MYVLIAIISIIFVSSKSNFCIFTESDAGEHNHRHRGTFFTSIEIPDLALALLNNETNMIQISIRYSVVMDVGRTRETLKDCDSTILKAAYRDYLGGAKRLHSVLQDVERNAMMHVLSG